MLLQPKKKKNYSKSVFCSNLFSEKNNTNFKYSEMKDDIIIPLNNKNVNVLYENCSYPMASSNNQNNKPVRVIRWPPPFFSTTKKLN